MLKFICWADGQKEEAQVFSVESFEEALECAANFFDVTVDKVRIIAGNRYGEAEFHGASHLLGEMQ